MLEGVAGGRKLMQFGTSRFRQGQGGAGLCSLVQRVASWWMSVQVGESGCKQAQAGAGWFIWWQVMAGGYRW